MGENILILKNINKKFPLAEGFFAKAGEFVVALDDLSFSIPKGEIFGIVGESGSGKSTLSKILVKAESLDGGSIKFIDSNKIIDYSSKKRADTIYIRNNIKYVFQNPTSALDPRLTVLELLTIGLKYSNTKINKDELIKKAEKNIMSVGLSKEDLERRVASFSGGQKQRISLARALMFNPKILICDEVVSALDVSIKSQILNLLVKIKKEFDLTIIFIAHDLSVVSYICDKVVVLKKGQIMEQGNVKDVFNNPQNNYTKMLINSIPSVEKKFF